MTTSRVNLQQLIEEHASMVNRLAKSGETILSDTTPDDMHIMHMLIGMAGEAGEIAEAILNVDKENMTEESGDYEFYFRGACDKAGLNPQSAAVFARHQSPERCFVLFDIEHSKFIDIFKKRFVYNKAIEHDDLVKTANNLRSALDVMYASTRVTYREALEHNMYKLEKADNARYKNGYSDEAAQQRADKQ